MVKKLLAIATLSLCTLALATPSQAQHRGGGSAPSAGRGVVRGGGGGVAVPRGSAPVFRGGSFNRPFFYPGYYYPSFAFGFNFGYPYYYSPYYYPYGYYGLYGGYPYGGYAYGGYPYGGGYPSYEQAGGIGGLRISDAPKDAQVYADGYYAGNVDDFNGTFQHLDLEAGPHHIEIRMGNQSMSQVDVNIVPGQTMTYHAH
jgi:hypothetical protein